MRGSERQNQSKPSIPCPLPLRRMEREPSPTDETDPVAERDCDLTNETGASGTLPRIACARCSQVAWSTAAFLRCRG
jgi:hypothetical protein